MHLRILLGLFLILFSSVKGTMEIECIALESSDVAHNVARALHKELYLSRYRTFADGEINVEIPDPVLFKDKVAVIIQSVEHPVNAHVLGIAFLAQELKNAGAQKVVAVIPYFGYSRQERSSIPGKPGHAAVIAKLFEGAGIDEIITVELHDEKVINFFSIPVHNLSVSAAISQHIKKWAKDSVCLVAPDKGAADFVEGIGKRVGLGTLIFSKERFGTDQTRVTDIEGSCIGSIGVVIDDIIATGGTAINVCNALPERGFEKIVGYFVHPVLAGPAIGRIADSCFSLVLVSNTLPLTKAALESKKIRQFDISPVIVAALEKLR